MQSMIKLEIIFDYMAENNLTKKAFCEKAHISLPQFYRLRKNCQNINLRVLFLIARAMNVPIVALLKEKQDDNI